MNVNHIVERPEYVLETLRKDEAFVLYRQKALEPRGFTLGSPAGSRFHSASAGNPKENRARIFVEG